jgi:hypothetical protein
MCRALLRNGRQPVPELQEQLTTTQRTVRNLRRVDNYPYADVCTGGGNLAMVVAARRGVCPAHAPSARHRHVEAPPRLRDHGRRGPSRVVPRLPVRHYGLPAGRSDDNDRQRSSRKTSHADEQPLRCRRDDIEQPLVARSRRTVWDWHRVLMTTRIRGVCRPRATGHTARICQCQRLLADVLSCRWCCGAHVAGGASGR